MSLKAFNNKSEEARGEKLRGVIRTHTLVLKMNNYPDFKYTQVIFLKITIIIVKLFFSSGCREDHYTLTLWP